MMCRSHPLLRLATLFTCILFVTFAPHAVTADSSSDAFALDFAGPLLASGTLAAHSASSESSGESDPVVAPQPLPPFPRSERREVSFGALTEGMTPVTMVGNARQVLEFSGRAEHVINVVAQLRDHRYEKHVPPYNCYGLFLNVELRPKQEFKPTKAPGVSPTTSGSEGENTNKDNVPSTASNNGAWTLFWETMATILDGSAFCNLLPTVTLRAGPVADAQVYFLVINSRSSYTSMLYNSTCSINVYLQQFPAAGLRREQNIFALVFPLVMLLFTLPYVLWRIDLVPPYIADVDIVDWLWFPAFSMRDWSIALVVRCHASILGAYAARRTAARQRQLEEQHRRVMAEAAARRAGAEAANTHTAMEETLLHEPREPSTRALGEQTPRHETEAREAAATVVVHVEEEVKETERHKLLLRGTEHKEASPHPLTAPDPALPHTRKAVGGSHVFLHTTPVASLAASNNTSSNAAGGNGGGTESHPNVMDHPNTNSTSNHNNNNNNNNNTNTRAQEVEEEEEDEDERICRICRDGEEEERLISACECTGSVRWIHRTCLDHWRLESAKRNVRNVNRCEICKKPFRIGISRRTLFWQSFQHILRTAVLVVAFVAFFIVMTSLLFSVLGEMSCRAPWHTVAYTTMFSLNGLVLATFVYFLLVMLAAFAYSAVYSRWHMRTETEAHVREFQSLPVFWTRWNTVQVVLTFVLGLVQVFSLGYLLKLFMYRTSTIVWNWEASPLVGGVMYMSLLAICTSAVRSAREVMERRRSIADNVSVETQTHANNNNNNRNNNNNSSNNAPHQGDPQRQRQRREEEEGQHGEEQMPDNGAATSPVEINESSSGRLRTIRAMEYCPRRPIAPQQR